MEGLKKMYQNLVQNDQRNCKQKNQNKVMIEIKIIGELKYEDVLFSLQKY